MKEGHKLALSLPLLLLVVSLPLPSFGAEPVIQAQLATAPKVPPAISRSKPARVVVHLEAKEFIGPLADGVQYKFWSFNGTVPAPMIRVRVGDTVELHLKNAEQNKFPHNIDLHAVNGPGGGAAVSLVAPGQESAFAFKTLAPGLYLYHCASPVPNIPAHIANGMYGMILVEPEGGLPAVDQEFYVLKSEFFTQPTGHEGVLELSMEKGLAEDPDYVVLNGREGALLGGELAATVGETVRIYFGNIGPNHAASFHIIGEIFDKVYVEGAINGLVNKNVQTTLVPAAGATIVELKVDTPANLMLVDASVFRIAKGASGVLSVTGKEDRNIFRDLMSP